jgi:hypothetical protein
VIKQGQSAQAAKSDDDDESDGVTFKAGAVCVNVSGSIDAIGQPSPSANRCWADHQFKPSKLKQIADAEARCPHQGRATDRNGQGEDTFELDWSSVSSTGREQAPTLDEATIAYLGLTVGYTDSLMNFWDSSDF